MITAVMPTYARYDVALERGEGVYAFGTDGRRYLDFGAGIAVASLGHCHPHLVKALKTQAETLWHVSNLYNIPGQERLAERLVANTFADAVFFNNSGNEAVELGFNVTVLNDCTSSRTPFEQSFYCEEVFPLYAKVCSHTELVNE